MVAAMNRRRQKLSAVAMTPMRDVDAWSSCVIPACSDSKLVF
jgi:hypothetical protein